MTVLMIDAESMAHLDGLIRNAPAEAVLGVDAAALLRLLTEGPSDDRELWALGSVVAGHRARVRLELLARAGAVPPLKLAGVVQGLVVAGRLQLQNTRRTPREWMSWIEDCIRPIAIESATAGRGGRRGRKPMSEDAGAQSTAERSRRYATSRQAEGKVRRSVWLTAEAAAALEELTDAADGDANAGLIVSQAILAFQQHRAS